MVDRSRRAVVVGVLSTVVDVRVFGVLALMIVTLALAGPTGPAAASVDVVADPQSESFVGTGAVLLPSTVAQHTRSEASRCVGCRWRVSTGCSLPHGSGGRGQDLVCLAPAHRCSDGQPPRQVWFARPSHDFEPVGIFCPSDGNVTSVQDATRHVRGGFEHRIPPLAVTCEPGRGVVVGIPLHCRSGQPGATVAWSDSVAGFTVHTRAEASWEWTFRQATNAPGSNATWTHRTREPGREYPSPGIRQAFSRPGINSVEVIARWRGEFTVEGLGTFPIEDELQQRGRLNVPTGSALGVVRG